MAAAAPSRSNPSPWRSRIVVGTLVALAFVWGLAAGAYEVFPYPALRAAKNWVDGHQGPPPNPSYQSNLKVPEIAAGMEQWGSPARIVMVGDSITAQGQWTEMFPGVSILNRGIGGDTAGGVADRAGLIAQTKPEAIFLMVGLNDLFYPRNTQEQIEAEFERAIVELGKTGAELFVQSIIICNSLNPVCTPPQQAKLSRFNSALERLSAKHGARFIDLNARMSGPDGLHPRFSWDGMHLNGEGFAEWRSILTPHIERLSAPD